MKILAIGDFHGKFPKKLKKVAREVDLILCTGDFGGSKKLLDIIFKYLGKEDWTKVIGKKLSEKYIMEDYNSGKKMIDEISKIGAEIFIIEGNWDFEGYKTRERWGGLKLINFSKLIKKKKNLHFLRKSSFRKIFGLTLFAYGGEVTPFIHTTSKGLYKGKKLLRNKRKEKKERKTILKRGIKNLDIFLAHYPPYGFFDKVKYKGYNPMKGKPVGIKAYADFIKKYSPRLFICGHMHEYQGMKKLGNTLLVTTGPASRGKAAVIDIPLNKEGKIKVKFIK